MSSPELDPEPAAVPSGSAARRILVVVPKLIVGGTERHLVSILPHLDRRRFAVEVATTRGSGHLEAPLRAAGISVATAPAVFRGRANALLALPWLWWRIVRTRPDLVHFLLPEAYLIGGLAALLAGRRRCVMSRRSLNAYQRSRPFSRRLEGVLHRRMAALVANSRAVVEELAAEGAPRDRLALIYNGIKVEDFNGVDREAARAALGVPAEAFVLTILATLLPYKGHGDLLEALAAVADRLPAGWRLLVVGRDEGLGPRLRSRAEAAGLAGHVLWLGERDDVARLLSATDVAVLASREEGFPNAALEAMAAGLAVIATRVGGCPEAVTDGVTGRLVPPCDPRALGQAIVELAGDRQRRAAMGRAGRQSVVERFSRDACVAAYERLYEAVLEGTPLAAASLLPLAQPLPAKGGQ